MPNRPQQKTYSRPPADPEPLDAWARAHLQDMQVTGANSMWTVVRREECRQIIACHMERQDLWERMERISELASLLLSAVSLRAPVEAVDALREIEEASR